MIDGFHRQVSKTLTEQITRRRDELSTATDWPDFQSRVGHLKGLEEAMQICVETERKIYGDDADR